MHTCIQSLPNEVLRRIFCIGSNDRPDFLPEECVPRKRKPFIQLARQICSRWQAIVDHPANPHFWVAHLFLGLHSRYGTLVKIGGYYDRSAVKRLLDFRCCLDSSKGCDLTISIYLPKLPKNIGDCPPGALLLLRLLFHGMQFILPYQHQVIIIEIDGCVPLAWGWFMSWIVSELKTAHILEEIHIQEDNDHEANIPPSISEILNLTGATDFEQLYSPPMKQTHLPFSLKHLPRLNTLTLPCTSWLSAKELKLNSSVSHLEIDGCLFQDSLLELLGTQPDLLENLITLSIIFHEDNPILSDRHENMSLHLSSSINLPQLMSISFWSLVSIHPNWLDLFFKHTRTPALERVSVNSHEKDLVAMDQKMGIEHPDNDTTAGWTSLLALDISTQLLQTSLNYLKMFASLSIESLKISIGTLKEGFFPQVADLIPHLKSHALHIKASYQNIQNIIHHINTQQVQSLEIEVHNEIPGDDPPKTSIDCSLLHRKQESSASSPTAMLFHREQPINLPSLTDINFHVLNRNLYRASCFLMGISANGLTRVSLTIQLDYYNDNTGRWEGHRVKDSISSIEPFSVGPTGLVTPMIYNPSILGIWKLTPNVQFLNINIKTDKYLVHSYSVTGVVSRINLIIGLIGFKEKHAQPLPHLQSLTMTYEIFNSQLDLMELRQSASIHGELHGSINELLITREKFGAVPLKLKPIELETKPGRIKKDPITHDILIKITVEA